MIRFFILFFFLSPLFSNAHSTSEILSVIGKSPTDISFLLLRNQLKLDRNFANAEKGIKFYLSENRQKIVSVLFANDSLDIDRQVFNQYQGSFDFPFSFQYNIYQVKDAFGKPVYKSYNAMTFQAKEHLVDVFYTDPTILDKVTYILVSNSPTKKENTGSVTILEKHLDKEDNELKTAILNVFKASQDPAFASICSLTVKQSNIWNYTHTQSTTIHIPDELYNFVYAFPFASSQRDFVSVLAENKGGDIARKAFYNFEQKLSTSLPPEEGWKKKYDNNTTGANQPFAVTFSKPSLGEVILDYVKSPRGEEVVYLRFLFQYR
jgi:hypothetical protein